MSGAIRRAGLTMFVVVMCGLAAGAPSGSEPPEQAAAVRVRATFVSGEPPREAEWLASTIRLRSEVGVLELRGSELLRVTFARTEDGPRGQDIVQLRDRSVWRGRVEGEQFAVRTEAGEEVWPRSQLREIRFVQAAASTWAAVLFGLMTLTLMEIVLGVDNVIFLSIIVAKLPAAQQPAARRIGLTAALVMRIVLLLFLSVLLGLTAPLFTLPPLPFFHDPEAREISGRDLILLAGGLFLIGKSVREMHEKLERSGGGVGRVAPRPATSFASAIAAIAVIDIVFSLDSVITAVGMVENVGVMIAAMVLAMLVMLAAAGPIGAFVQRHPTVQVLALSFLILIGVLLAAEGLGQHLDKGYIYFAMAFAAAVEMVNLRLRAGSISHSDAPTPASDTSE